MGEPRTAYVFDNGQRWAVQVDGGEITAHEARGTKAARVYDADAFAAELLKLARLLDSYDPWWEKRWAEAPPAVVERAAREKGEL